MAKILRQVVTSPEVVIDHPRFDGIENAYLVIDGTLYVAGLSRDGRVHTCFPPGEGSPILEEWVKWKNES